MTDATIGSLVLYIIPSIVAAVRDCKDFRWIFVVNVALGWTIFGWFAALIFAFVNDTR